MNPLKLLTAFIALASAAVSAHAQCATPTFLRAEESSLVRYSHVVNDIGLPLGNNQPYRMTSISGRVATNCTPGFEVWFEVYNSTLIGTPGTRIGHFRATSLTPTGRKLNVNGLVQVEFAVSAPVPALSPVRAGPGARIWIGAYIRDTFSFNERGFAIADSVKPSSHALPMVRTSPTGLWTSAARGTCDLALTARLAQFCRADFNQDGSVDQADATAFMAAWLQHSPLADFDGIGGVTPNDRTLFLNAYATPCAAIPGDY